MLTELALRNKLLVFTFVILFTIAGFFAYSKMSRAEDPEWQDSSGVVALIWPGQSAARCDLHIAKPISEALRTIPELREVRATAQQGGVEIYYETRDGIKNMSDVRRRVKDVVEQAYFFLPKDCIYPMFFEKLLTAVATTITLTDPDMSLSELSDTAERIKTDLLLLEGVEKVDIFGQQAERIFIDLDPGLLRTIGLSALQMRDLISAHNINLGSGSLVLDGSRIYIQPGGNFVSLTDIEQALIPIPSQRTAVFLKDVAQIRRGFDSPARSAVHVQGHPGLVLSVKAKSGGNILEFGEQMEALVGSYKKKLPAGTEVNILNFQPAVVSTLIGDFQRNIVEAVVLVLVICFIALGWRVGLLVTCMIPTTLGISFLILFLLGQQINMITLAALILALGLLVDNGIVMAESLITKLSRGLSYKDAAVESCHDLAHSLTTGALATCFSFLPVYLAVSAVGEITGALFTVISTCLLVSALLSLTFIPLLGSLMLKAHAHEEGHENWLVRGYGWLLSVFLKMRYIAVPTAFALLVVAAWQFGKLPQVFYPLTERTLTCAFLEFPLGTDITSTAASCQKLEEAMKATFADGRMRSIVSYMGTGGPRFHISLPYKSSAPNLATIILDMQDLASLEEAMRAVRTYCAKNIPEASVVTSRISYGAGSVYPVELAILGNSVQQIFAGAELVKNKLKTIPGVKLVCDDWGPCVPTATVDMDQYQLALAGLMHSDVAVSLATLYSGFEVSRFAEDDKNIPIHLVGSGPQTFDAVLNSDISSQRDGHTVPLFQVASVSTSWAPWRQYRMKGNLAVKVQAQLEPGYTAKSVQEALDVWLATPEATLPAGTHSQWTGALEASAIAGGSLITPLPVAALLMFVILLLQFGALRPIAIVALTLPLTLIGSTIAMMIAQLNISFVTFVGLIALAGIVMNNTIILLMQLRASMQLYPDSALQAILHAGKLRLRPILISASASAIGMIPLIRSGGPLFSPMSITLFGGILFGTLITLLIVPCLFALFGRLSIRAS